MKKYDRQMMTEESINRVILTVSAPLMVNNMVRTLYNLTDGLFVARLSAEDFAATAFVWPLNFLFIAIGLGVGVGTTVLIAQYLGANRMERARHYAGHAIIITTVLGFIMSTIGYALTPQMLHWMGAEGSFHLKATSYLKVSFIGLLFDFTYFGFQSILNAEGRTRFITIMSAISAVANIILDPIFIFDQIPFINLPGLGMGICGAAWATVISKVLLYGLVVWAVRREADTQVHWSTFSWDFQTLQHIFRLATPSAIGYAGSAMGFTMMNSFITAYGTNTMAAYSMGNRISDLLTQPQMGIGAAMTSIIGQNVGADKINRVKEIFKRATQMILAFSIIASLIIFVFREPLLQVFLRSDADSDLWAQALEYLYYSVFIIFFMGLFSTLNGFFQGVGRTNYSMYLSAGRLWALRLPMIWFFTYVMPIGPTGIWISMLGSNLLIVVFGFFLYSRLDWHRISVTYEQTR